MLQEGVSTSIKRNLRLERVEHDANVAMEALFNDFRQVAHEEFVVVSVVLGEKPGFEVLGRDDTVLIRIHGVQDTLDLYHSQHVNG